MSELRTKIFNDFSQLNKLSDCQNNKKIAGPSTCEKVAHFYKHICLKTRKESIGTTSFEKCRETTEKRFTFENDVS
jgi:hypothetical protein